MRLELKTPDDGRGGFWKGAATKLMLDGVDISQYVSRVVVTVDVNEVVAAEITLYPTELDIDLEALVTQTGASVG